MRQRPLLMLSPPPTTQTIGGTPSPLLHDLRIERLAHDELAVTYARPLVRLAAFAALFFTAAVAIAAYVESGVSVVRLSCARHPIESNASYHLHEDSDCFLEVEEDLKHTASTFELSSVRVVSVVMGMNDVSNVYVPASERAALKTSSATRKSSEFSYEVWLDGPKHLNHLPQEKHLWLKGLEREEAVAYERSVSSFLNETRSGNAGLISLEIITRNDRLRFYVSVYFLVVALALDVVLLYFLPYAEVTTIKEFHLKQEYLNALGCALSFTPLIARRGAARLGVWPLYLVSGCAVDSVVIRDVAPAGRLSLKPRVRQEFSLFIVLGGGGGGGERATHTFVPPTASEETNASAATSSSTAEREEEVVGQSASPVIAKDDDNNVRLPLLMGSTLKRRAPLDVVAVQFNSFLTTHRARLETSGGTVTAGHPPRAQASCVVCFDRPVNTTLLPCRHTCVCQTCAGSLQKCPMCREVVKEKMRIFM